MPDDPADEKWVEGVTVGERSGVLGVDNNGTLYANVTRKRKRGRNYARDIAIPKHRVRG